MGERFRIAFFSLLFLLLSGTAAAKVIYVDKGARGHVNGTSWGNAFTSVSKALVASASGDEIWVKRATYKERITLITGVSLLGGFDGSEESREERRAATNVTTIDGDAWENGPAITAIYDGLIDGFMITGGSNSGICCYFGSPTILNCTITGNTAYYGSGVYCQDSSPTLANCTISDNSTNGNGGGIYCDNSSPMLTNCTIIDNVAKYGGGGVYCYNNSSPMLTDCTISDNSTNGNGGGIYCDKSSPMLTNCTIRDNVAKKGGGGVYCDSYSPAVLTYCAISANSATENGGGFFVACGNPASSVGSTMIGCRIEGNVALSGAGGYVLSTYSGSICTLENCVIARNRAFHSGGGLTVSGRTLSTINCTIADNAAPELESVIEYLNADSFPSSLGGGVYVDRGALEATNTIFADNLGGAIGYSPTGLPSTLNHCLFHGQEDDESNDGVGGSIVGDPNFLLRYHLGYASAAVDAGTDVTDIEVDAEGLPRPVDVPGYPENQMGLGYDIGAYECQWTKGSVATSTEDSRMLLFGIPDEGDGPLPRRCVVIQNVGFGDLHFIGDGIAVIQEGAEEFYFPDGPPDVSPLLPGATRAIEIVFRPETGGAREASLVITTDDDEHPNVTISLVGNVGTVFVDVNAPVGGNGLDWTHALQKIGEAIDAAPIGAGVWVADGTYSESITMKSGISLYGGFNGTETDLSQRNLSLHTTAIDASKAFGRPYHVVSMIDVTSTRLDGFTITGGSANGFGEDQYGGGMFCRNVNDTNVIERCTIVGNSADGLNCFAVGTPGGHGGGMCILNGYPSLINCVLENNSANGASTDSSNPAEGGLGGGVYVDGGGPTFLNCVLSGNTTNGADAESARNGAAGGHGGGIYSSQSGLRLTNSIFSGNMADGGLGGHGYTGGWFLVCGWGDCWEEQGPGGPGGNGGDGGYGGSFFASGGSPDLMNCLFYSNSADPGQGGEGGQGYPDGATGPEGKSGVGGGVYCTDGATPRIINTICAFNYDYAIAEGSGDSDPAVSNCLFYESDELDYYDENTTAIHGADGINALPEAQDNCSGDPRFTDPLKADFHLLPDSACIDAGDPDLEDGCLPPGLGTVRSDMGAYGGPGNCGWLPPELRPTETPTPTETVAFTPTRTRTPTITPTASPSPTPPSPDLDQNGVIDGEDLFIFSRGWFRDKNETDFPGDLTGDGFLDGRDLLRFIEEWINESK